MAVEDRHRVRCHLHLARLHPLPTGRPRRRRSPVTAPARPWSARPWHRTRSPVFPRAVAGRLTTSDWASHRVRSPRRQRRDFRPWSVVAVPGHGRGGTGAVSALWCVGEGRVVDELSGVEVRGDAPWRGDGGAGGSDAGAAVGCGRGAGWTDGRAGRRNRRGPAGPGGRGGRGVGAASAPGPTGCRLRPAPPLRPSAVPLAPDPRPALVSNRDQAADRLDRTGLAHLFFADAVTGCGSTLYRRFDGCHGLMAGAA